MISKHLFQAVILDPKEKDFEMHNDPHIIYGPYQSLVVSYKFGYRGYYPKGFEQTINLYELSHRCKEWATSKGFIILTYGEAYYNVDVHYRSNKSKFGNLAFSETDLEEPEAVFKACEFILTQLNKEDIS